MEREREKKKNETSGQNSIAYCWHNTHLHMRQMSFAGKIDHLADAVFGWRINIACCCASIGTRILLTSLVDLVTGADEALRAKRSKPLSISCTKYSPIKIDQSAYRVCTNEVVDLKTLWSKRKKKKRRGIQICVKFWEQICFSSLFLFKEEDQTNRVYNYVPSFRLPSNW